MVGKLVFFFGTGKTKFELLWKKGEAPLDQRCLHEIRRLTYCHYSLKTGECEEKDWTQQCIKAIDEVNRCKSKAKQ